MKLPLVLAVHAHQPVGNFPEVLARAHDRAYRPFLDALLAHPHVRLAMHLSGPLLDWLEAERPAFVAEVRTLVDRRQVELLGGGLEEPILASLPDRDALGQLAEMRARLLGLFGVEPQGLWLTERVWSPELPRLLAATGHRFTFVDDSHLREAGIEGPLRGHYVTEHAGAATALFPIDQGLRYRIPYARVDDVLEHLRELASTPGAVTFGDDLEKFGLWPGTHEWVYGRGWLDAFFRELGEASGELECVLPSEWLARGPATARAYLPTTSYPELGVWAMSAQQGRRVEALRKELGERGSMVRGGTWPDFLAKYPEANGLHKRMVRTSNKLAEAEAELGATAGLQAARRELYKGQCNCAYWHGIFGGLYLPHLRHAAYAALIRAENLVDAETRGHGDFIEYDEDDLDADLRDEALLANAQVSALVDPDEGGALVELDFRPPAVCVTHLAGRREEGYHRELRELPKQPAPKHAEADAPPNIHGHFSEKEPGLAKLLVDDGARRLSFIDRFHAPGFGLEQLVRASDGDVGQFAFKPYAIEASGVDEDGDLTASVTLVREAKVQTDGGPRQLLVEKTFHVPIDAPRLEAEYILENPGDAPMTFVFAPELNFTLLSAQQPQRYLELSDGRSAPLGVKANHGATTGLRLIDEFQGIAIDVQLEREVELWSYPVETVNLSEEGFERTYQGTCFLLRMPIALPPRESARIVIRVELAKVELEPEEPTAEPQPPEPTPEPTESA